MAARGDLPLEARLARMENKLDWVVEHVTILRVKAGLWGAGAGAIVSFLISKYA